MRLPPLPVLFVTFAVAGVPQAHAQVLWPHGLAASPLVPGTALPRDDAAMAPPALRITALISVPPDSPGRQCRQAIRAAEAAAHVPDQLMAAIGRVESGRREADGSINPWPWSINAEGIDHVYETKAEAIAAVRALQRHGVRSIDVGCMQVNLQQHPHAFATLADAFDPSTNAAYAARFLVQLREQTGSWPTATAWYHSATPDIGADYRRKVMAVWPAELKQGRMAELAEERTKLASAWLATTRGSAATWVQSISRQVVAHRIPAPAGVAGRGLSVYRAEPIPVAARAVSAPG